MATYIFGNTIYSIVKNNTTDPIMREYLDTCNCQENDTSIIIVKDEDVGIFTVHNKNAIPVKITNPNLVDSWTRQANSLLVLYSISTSSRPH